MLILIDRLSFINANLLYPVIFASCERFCGNHVYRDLSYAIVGRQPNKQKHRTKIKQQSLVKRQVNSSKYFIITSLTTS